MEEEEFDIEFDTDESGEEDDLDVETGMSERERKEMASPIKRPMRAEEIEFVDSEKEKPDEDFDQEGFEEDNYGITSTLGPTSGAVNIKETAILTAVFGFFIISIAFILAGLNNFEF